MSKLERDIAKKVPTECKKLGLRALRVSMRPGVEVGWPDWLIFGPNHVLGLETKRPGKDATPIQKERGKTMVAYGQSWSKIDSVDDLRFSLLNFAKYCVGERTLSRTEFEAMNTKVKS